MRYVVDLLAVRHRRHSKGWAHQIRADIFISSASVAKDCLKDSRRWMIISPLKVPASTSRKALNRLAFLIAGGASSVCVVCASVAA